MRKVLNLLFGALLLAAIIWGIWWAVSTAVSWFLSLKPETMTPVAAVVGVLLVPIITYFTTRELERRRTLESAIRGEKNKFYDELIRDLLKMLDLGKAGKPDEAFITKLFADATPRLITYGSRGVIRAWNAFRKESANTNGTSVDTLFAFENLAQSDERRSRSSGLDPDERGAAVHLHHGPREFEEETKEVGGHRPKILVSDDAPSSGPLSQCSSGAQRDS